MRVLGYTWAGVRTDDLKSTAHFFADTLGLALIREGKEMVQFEMPSGQLFKVFGRESSYYWLHSCPVLAFQVEDVRAARSWNHAALSSSPMSMATNRNPGLIFAGQTATFTSFGRQIAP